MASSTRLRSSRQRLVGLVRWFAVACGVGVLFAAVPASAAYAHAVLESTDPPAGAVVPSAPRVVSLRFGESVGISLGSVRVFDQRGQRLETGPPRQPNGQGGVVQVAVPGARAGTYIVTWRVVSADSHPVSGAFTFTVGKPNGAGRAVAGLTQKLLANQAGSKPVGVLLGVARLVLFVGLALLLGGAAFAVLVWSDGRGSKTVKRLIWAGWLAAVIATLTAFVLEGPYGAALPLLDVLHTDLLSAVWRSQYGRATAARFALLLAVLPLLRVLLPARPVAEYPLPRWWRPTAGALALAIAITPGLAGHAASGRVVAIAVPADALHIIAMSLWLGGLAILAACVLSTVPGDAEVVAVTRFSRLAFGCVVVLVATGAFQVWREVGALHEFVSTTYGRLLLVKLGAFLALVAVAAVSRNLVQRRVRVPTTVAQPIEAIPAVVGASAGSGREAARVGTHDQTGPARETNGGVASRENALRQLRRSVGAEVLVAVVILTVTALLVNTAPARSLENVPYEATIKTSTVWFDVLVIPGRHGPNDVHVTTFTPSGGQRDVRSMQVTFSQPKLGIAPITVPVQRAGPSHYFSPGFVIPFGGKWEMTVRALLSDVDEVSGSTAVSIR